MFWNYDFFQLIRQAVYESVSALSGTGLVPQKGLYKNREISLFREATIYTPDLTVTSQTLKW